MGITVVHASFASALQNRRYFLNHLLWGEAKNSYKLNVGYLWSRKLLTRVILSNQTTQL